MDVNLSLIAHLPLSHISHISYWKTFEYLNLHFHDNNWDWVAFHKVENLFIIWQNSEIPTQVCYLSLRFGHVTFSYWLVEILKYILDTSTFVLWHLSSVWWALCSHSAVRGTGFCPIMAGPDRSHPHPSSSYNVAVTEFPDSCSSHLFGGTGRI